MIKGTVKRLLCSFLVCCVFCNSLFFVSSTHAAVTATVDYSVDNFDAEYTISKNSKGIATAHVKESIDVTFPNTNRNHGIDRELTFLTNFGKTQIMDTEKEKFSITRNGEPEPFAVLQRNDNIVLQIGSYSTYLHGTQNYVIEYDIYNFISDSDDSQYLETPYQEMLLQAVNSEWAESVNDIDISIHFSEAIYNSIIHAATHDDSVEYTNKAVIHSANTTSESLSTWCFVANSIEAQSRCSITDDTLGLKYTASNLAQNENIKIVTIFSPNTFEISDEAYHGDSIYLDDLNTNLTLSKVNNESILKINQTFTAVFPSNNNDEVFVWNIPYATAKNTRITLTDLDTIKTTFDGEPASIELDAKDDDYAAITFAAPENGFNKHTFTISYELHNVTNSTLDFRPEFSLFDPDDETDMDEFIFELSNLVWHHFTRKMTATLKLEDNLMSALAEEPNNIYCFNAGATSDSICNISRKKDSLIFSAENLLASDNFTIIADFQPNTFTRIPANKSNLNVIFASFEFIFLVVVIIVFFKLQKSGSKKLPVLYTIYTIVACILTWLFYNAPAFVYEIFGYTIHSEHAANFLRLPCTTLLIVICAFILYYRPKTHKKRISTSHTKNTATVIIATHKKYRAPKDSIYLPLRVGAKSLDKETGKVVENPSFGYKTDATGENISTKNSTFCELTGLYWAWKNLDSDYIGLAHYRRHFSLTGRHGKDADGRFSSVLTETQLNQLINVEHYDIILPKPRNYYIENLYGHYIHTCFRKPLDQTREIIAEYYPEYLKEFDNLKNRTSAHMFNMLIMRKDLLDDYCEWLFDILFKLEDTINAEENPEVYTAFHNRFYGRISELLLDVYLNTRFKTTKERPKIKELPVISMEDTKVVQKGKAFLLAKFTGKKYDKSF